MNWVLSILHVEVLNPPVCQNVILFGARVFKGGDSVIMKSYRWVLTPDCSPYKKEGDQDTGTQREDHETQREDIPN